MDLHAVTVRRLFNAIGMGNVEIVRQCLDGMNLQTGESSDQTAGERAHHQTAGERPFLLPAIDPNVRDRRGTPALIRAVRTRIVEAGVVEALLDAGADIRATDAAGVTALVYARRRLALLGDKPDKFRRSKSLDEYGNLRLTRTERAFLGQVRAAAGRYADEAEDIYLQERRKAAVRQFTPRRELNLIIRRLEEAAG